MIDLVLNLRENVTAGARRAEAAVQSLNSAIKITIATVAGLSAATVGLAIYQSEWREQLTATLGSLSDIGTQGAPILLGMLDDLSDALPYSEKQIADWQATLLEMGYHGNTLKDNINALGSAVAIAPRTGAKAFESLTSRIQEAEEAGSKLKLSDKQIKSIFGTGVNPEDIAKKLGNIPVKDLILKLKSGQIEADKFGTALNQALVEKGAPAVAELNRQVGVQLVKAWDNVQKLFRGINIDPFLDQLQDLLSIFDRNTESGKALHVAVKAVFDDLFGSATSLMPTIKGVIIDVVVGLINMTTGVYQAMIAFEKWKQSGDQYQTLINLLYGVWDVIKLVGGAAWIAAQAVGSLADQLLRVIGFLDKMDISNPLGNIDYFKAAKEHLDNAKVGSGVQSALGISMGENLATGFAQGVTNKGPEVHAATTGMVDQATKGVTETAQIHSPSKLMFEKGGFMAEGFSQGMTDGVSDVKASSSRMTKEASSVSFDKSLNSAGDKNTTINVGGIHISGAGKDAETITEEAISLIFERVAMTQGVL